MPDPFIISDEEDNFDNLSHESDDDDNEDDRSLLIGADFQLQNSEDPVMPGGCLIFGDRNISFFHHSNISHTTSAYMQWNEEFSVGHCAARLCRISLTRCLPKAIFVAGYINVQKAVDANISIENYAYTHSYLPILRALDSGRVDVIHIVLIYPNVDSPYYNAMLIYEVNLRTYLSFAMNTGFVTVTPLKQNNELSRHRRSAMFMMKPYKHLLNVLQRFDKSLASNIFVAMYADKSIRFELDDPHNGNVLLILSLFFQRSR